MKKIFFIASVLFIFRANILAQFDFSSENNHQSFFLEKSLKTLEETIDSLTLDSIITAYWTSRNIPGISTLIVKNNLIIWNKNYGYRNLAQQLPIEDSTFFLMGSVSKTFVATAIMQLWENGMIDLDSNINNYLPPGFTVVNPHYPGIAITAKMLLVHTSSIHDNVLYQYTSCGDSPIELDTFVVNYFTPGGIYYSLGNFWNRPPGQDWDYSNVGYSLLAVIVESITGQSFDDYCRDSIFIPLSMNSTSWFLQGMDTTKVATPYNGSPPSPICHQGHPSYPSGFLRTNKMEMLNYLQTYINNGVFNNYRLLDSTTIAYMLSDHLNGFHPIMQLPWWTWVQGLSWWNVFPIDSTAWGRGGSWNGAFAYVSFEQSEKWLTLWTQNWRLDNINYSAEGEINYYLSLYARSYVMEPAININLTELIFAEVPIGSSEVKPFSIINNGNLDLIISDIQSSDPVFTVNDTSFTIPPGDSQEVEVTFTPAALQIYSGVIEITHNAQGSPATVTVIGEGTTDVEDELQPIEYSLEQNHPNPFNPTTVIKYSIPEVSKVILKLYNLLGEEVATLVNEEKIAGYYKVEFNAANLPSGVYFYQLKAGEFSQTKKMVLLK